MCGRKEQASVLGLDRQASRRKLAGRNDGGEWGFSLKIVSVTFVRKNHVNCVLRLVSSKHWTKKVAFCVGSEPKHFP